MCHSPSVSHFFWETHSMRDLYNDIGPAQSLSPRAVTAAVNGVGVDLRGFDGATFLVDTGTISGTTPTVTVQLQESDDNSTFTAIAAADLIGGALPATIGTAEDDTIYKRGYIGTRRYVRVAVTAVGGTSPSLPMAGSVIRSHPAQLPVA